MIPAIPLIVWHLMASSPPLAAAPPDVQTPITLEQILSGIARNEQSRVSELRSYTSTRTYRLDNRRFNKKAEMTVQLRCDFPGRKAFSVVSESGPGIVRQKVLRRMVETEVEASQSATRGDNQISAKNYDFRLLREDVQDGRPVHVLALTPKGKSPLLMRGEIWVDAEDLDITKIVGQPAKNPSFWIHNSRFVYRFRKVGGHWMPSTTESEAEARVFGRTEVTIHFENYQMNPEAPTVSAQ